MLTFKLLTNQLSSKYNTNKGFLYTHLSTTVLLVELFVEFLLENVCPQQ